MSRSSRSAPSVVTALLTTAAVTLSSACLPAPRVSVFKDRVVVQRDIRQPVFAVDAKTGKSIAQMPGEGWADAPTVRGDIVYFHGKSGLVARDLKSGAVLWRVLMNVSLLFPVVASKDKVFAPQLIQKDLLSKPEMSWVAFDAVKGTKLFELRADAYAPLAANDDVAVTVENRELCGYSVTDGKERWRSTVAAGKPLLIEGGRLFARTGDELGVFNASSGALQRRIDLGGTDALGWFRPGFAARGPMLGWIEGHVLNVADVGSGKKVWQHEGSDLFAMTSGVLASARHDLVEGLDLATGAKKWKLVLEDDADSLSADGDTIVARAGDVITVIDAATGKRRFDFDTESGAAASAK